MSLTSLSTLATLDRSGPRRVTDLAFIVRVAQPWMTALVSTLERSGLVERRDDPADKRVALVALTPAGAELLRSRRRSGAEALEQLIDKLPADEAAALVAAIPALRHLRELDNADREPAIRAPGGGPQGAAGRRSPAAPSPTPKIGRCPPSPPLCPPSARARVL